jgi:dCTP deaminase
MMWSDVDILAGLQSGDLRIDPWDEKALQPASVDLRLGNYFTFQRQPTKREKDSILQILDVKQSPTSFFSEVVFIPDEGDLLLHPQEFLLAMTREKISLSNKVVGRLEGKSSLARLGISVHSTGGFIDPGNQDLNITLEITNHGRFPIRLYVGMWIAQIAFQGTLTPAQNPYGPDRKSRYYADGKPVLSRASENLGV